MDIAEAEEKLGEWITQTQDVRNEGILASWMPKWVTNTFFNFPTLFDEFQIEDMSIDSLPRVRDEPAIIIGSGPSLDKTAPLLRDWKGTVFSTLSNARIPTRWGHQPEYVCCFDAGDSSTIFLDDGYDWKGSVLITHPAVSPLVLKMWEWARKYYIMMHLGNQWFDTVNPLVFGGYQRFPGKKPADVRIAISNAGCTVNNEIQIAHWLGYDPLFLIGCDFGYPGNQVKAQGWIYKNHVWEGRERIKNAGMEYQMWSERCGTAPYRSTEQIAWAIEASRAFNRRTQEFIEHHRGSGPENEWIEAEVPKMGDFGRRLHTSNNGILTTEEQIEYKIAMLTVYALDCPQLIDCSDGIITELPKPPGKTCRGRFKEVVKNGGRGYEGIYRGKEEIKRICNQVLSGDKILPFEGAPDRGHAEVRDSGDGCVRSGEDGGGNGRGQKGNQ